MSASQNRVWTSLDLLRWMQDHFARKGIASPRLEAEWLLAEVLGVERIRIYTDFEKPVGEDRLARLRELVVRRAEKREPLQYLLGHTEFLGLRLKVTPAVLIPRPETEELAEWAVARLKECPDDALCAVDLGTGSGCLALALARMEPRARVWAVDCSAGALEVARENAAALALSEKVEFLVGDLCAPLPEALKGRADLIVSNPPYIAEDLAPTLMPEVREHEPCEALFAAEGGLAVIRRLVAEAPEWLRAGGRLGLEISPEQAEAVLHMLNENGAWHETQTAKDVRGLIRFAYAVRA